MLNGVLKLSDDGINEASHVGGSVSLKGDYLGKRSEADISRRLGFGAENAEPFFSDHQSEKEIIGFSENEFAEVENGVDVAPAWVRHRHHMTVVGCSGGGGFNFVIFHWYDNM